MDNFRLGGYTLCINGEERCLQYPIKEDTFVDREDALIVVLQSFMDEREDGYDIGLGDEHRNVLAIGSEGEILWAVSAPEPTGERDPEGFLSVFEIGSNVWARNRNERTYRIDIDSGDLVASVPEDTLPVTTDGITQPLPVEKAVQIPDGVVVLLDTTSVRVQERYGQNPPLVNKNVRAYDRGGDLLWTVEELPGAADTYIDISTEGGELWAHSYGGTDFRVDPDTGDHRESRLTK